MLFLSQATLPSKDLNKLEADMNGNRRAAIPLHALKLQRPDDGMPCVGDWLTCCISFMFSGSRLAREPIDCNAKVLSSTDAFLTVKKGFTRLMLGSNC